jgi:hypothetical protein
MLRPVLVGFGATLVLVLFSGGGCSSSSTNEVTPSGGCTPGDTRACTGPGQCAGGQACTDAGTWSACDCQEAGPGCSLAEGGACRACCDSAYPLQKAGFVLAAKFCACNSETTCKALCSPACTDVDAGAPSDVCLVCVAAQDATCVNQQCSGVSCADYVQCIAGCV